MQTKYINTTRQNEVKIVSRLKEINLFENHLTQLRSGYQTAKSVIDFWGIPGIGKSTLLQEILIRSLSYNNKTVFVDFKEFLSINKKLLDLEDCEIISAKLYNEMFKKKMSRDYKAPAMPIRIVGANNVSSKFVGETINYLSLDERHLVVFLFDSVEYCSPEVFQWLERFVFSPLVSTKKVMIVLASQSRKNWGMFDVRQCTLEHKIKPFDSELVREQIGYDNNVTKELASRIFDITFGVPACNWLVYKSLEKLRKNKEVLFAFNNFNKKRLVRSEVEYFFGHTVKKLNPELKFVLKLTSQLRWFDYAILREILVYVNPNKYNNIKASKFRDITRRLEETNFINWDIQNKGFAMDYTLRKIISLDLKINNPVTFSQIQHIVIQWFRRLVKEYDSSYLFFLDLAYYRAFFGDLKLIPAEVNQAINNIEYSQRKPLDKIMTLEQILRAIDEYEYKEIIPAEYIELVQKKSEEVLERLLNIENS